jgi:hypothetical protein
VRRDTGIAIHRSPELDTFSSALGYTSATGAISRVTVHDRCRAPARISVSIIGRDFAASVPKKNLHWTPAGIWFYPEFSQTRVLSE